MRLSGTCGNRGGAGRVPDAPMQRHLLDPERVVLVRCRTGSLAEGHSLVNRKASPCKFCAEPSQEAKYYTVFKLLKASFQACLAIAEVGEAQPQVPVFLDQPLVLT